jgi:hypothetical protein
MYAISLLKHVVVVLSKSEGPQKWFAPCSTDVHRVARTIHVSILEKDSHRQNNMIMRNEVWHKTRKAQNIAQNMEILDAKSVCLLEQLRPLLRTVDFCHVLQPKGENVRLWAVTTKLPLEHVVVAMHTEMY